MATTLNQARGISLFDDSSVSNLKTVYANFNGQEIPATYDLATGLWSVEMSAPAVSSWSQLGHVYTITLVAQDLAGNIATVGSTDPTYGSELKIRVLEKTKPVVSITYPTQGSVIGSSDVEILLDATDNGGSGLNMSTMAFAINGVPVSNASITWEENDDGHLIGTYEAIGLSDGQNILTLDVTDNDGNTAIRAETTFSISTVAPTLTVTKPAEDLITNASPLLIEGYAAPGTGAVYLVGVTVNNTPMPVVADGSFSYEYHFQAQGEYILNIVATDSIGKSTVVVRKIIYDTTLPIISDVVAESVVVNTGEVIKVTFRVEDPADGGLL